jgi:hypothetical protein
MADSLEIAAKLDEARALIEKGWVRGSYEVKGCGFCTYGAVQKAVTGNAEEECNPRTKPLEALLRQVTGATSLAHWNDAPERTQAEVIEAFRKAAELARGEAAWPTNHPPALPLLA